MFLKSILVLMVSIVTTNTMAQITEIIDSTGDGSSIVSGANLHVDRFGNVYMGYLNNSNVLRISASSSCSVSLGDCIISEIIDSSGDGSIVNDRTSSVTSDSSGNVFLTGQFSDNMWRILNPNMCKTSGTTCDIEEIIDSTGDGTHGLVNPVGSAVDSMGNVYVVGFNSNNVFKIDASTTCSTSGTICVISEIIDSTGDGTNPITQPAGIAIDSQDNIYISSQNSDNVFKIANPVGCSTTGTQCTITEIIDATGDGSNNLRFVRAVTVDSNDNVYLASFGLNSSNPPRVFKVNTPGSCNTFDQMSQCTITEIYNSTSPQQISNMTVDALDNIYFAGGNGDNAFRITTPTLCSTSGTPCEIVEIITATGDGVNILDGPGHIAVYNSDVYVSGGTSQNAFRLTGQAFQQEEIFMNGFE